MSNEKTLDISWNTLLKISLVILIFYIFYQIKDILVWIIFAFIISVLFNPAIDFFEKLRVPRVLATIFVYSVFFGFLILVIFLTIPFFTSEIEQFSQVLPQYFERISPFFQGLSIKAFEDINVFISTLKTALGKMVANIFNVLFVIFGGIFTAIFILTVAIFFSLEEKEIKKTLCFFFPGKNEIFLLTNLEKCEKKISNWFLTRIIACFFVGLISLIAFFVFNTPYPLSLGLLAGLLNFIPVVGPIVTAILLFIILSVENLSKAIFVLIAFTLIQQIENNILTPFLSKKFIGLSPSLVLIALTIGGTLFGFLGAVLAVPLAGIVFEFSLDFLKRRKKSETLSSF